MTMHSPCPRNVTRPIEIPPDFLPWNPNQEIPGFITCPTCKILYVYFERDPLKKGRWMMTRRKYDGAYHVHYIVGENGLESKQIEVSQVSKVSQVP